MLWIPLKQWEAFDRVQQEMARSTSLNRKKQKDVKTELGSYFGKYALTELPVCGKCDTACRFTYECFMVRLTRTASQMMRRGWNSSKAWSLSEMAGKDNIAGEDFIALSKEIDEAKRVIAEKKKQTKINPEWARY